MIMKKYLFTIVLLLGVTFSFSASTNDDDIKITEDNLPENAKMFLKTHFSAAKFLWGERDNDSYDIRLDNGFEIEFSIDGEWDSIDSNRTKELPASILALIPQSISEYVKKNHQEAIITSIDKKHDWNRKDSGYEIELNNNKDELEFGANGNFIRYDK
jgi:hypothetical protein